MEIFIGPKLKLPKESLSVMAYLDIDLNELINAILQDIRVVGEDCFDSLILNRMTRGREHWSTTPQENEQLKTALRKASDVIHTWLYCSLDFEILLYFYCRKVINVESLPENDFSTYFLDLDVLADDNYCRNTANVRQSVHECRTRFLNR